MDHLAERVRTRRTELRLRQAELAELIAGPGLPHGGPDQRSYDGC